MRRPDPHSIEIQLHGQEILPPKRPRRAPNGRNSVILPRFGPKVSAWPASGRPSRHSSSLHPGLPVSRLSGRSLRDSHRFDGTDADGCPQGSRLRPLRAPASKCGPVAERSGPRNQPGRRGRHLPQLSPRQCARPGERHQRRDLQWRSNSGQQVRLYACRARTLGRDRLSSIPATRNRITSNAWSDCPPKR